MALKDILSSAKYADDMVLSLPDGTTATVGEMRSMNLEDRNALVQRAKVMEDAETALASRIMDAQRRGILTEPTPEPEIRREAAAQFGLSEDDPLLGQVAKEFKRLEAENRARESALEARFKTEVDSLKGITGKVTGAYLDDYYAAKFQAAASTLPTEIKAKAKLEDVINYAKDHNLMDKVGRYNIDMALDQLTWEDRKAAMMVEARAEGQKTADKAAQLASMNRPSPNALRTRQVEKEGFDPMTKEGKVKSFDEALADAANDDNLWNSLAQTSSGFGPN